MSWCEYHQTQGFRHVCLRGHPIEQRYRHLLSAVLPCNDLTVEGVEKRQCPDAMFYEKAIADRIAAMRAEKEKRYGGEKRDL